MPEISSFFGIIITMNYNEHNPPHFHARYNSYKAIFSIQTLEMMAGSLPKRAVNLVFEWASLHRDALLENWNRMRDFQAPHRIPSLTD